MNQRYAMLHRPLLLIILILLLTGIAAAQPRSLLRGTIRDTAGKGVPGATIRIVGTMRGAISKFDGTYIVAGPRVGRYPVIVTAIGYLPYHDTITIALDSTTRLDVTLRIDTTPRIITIEPPRRPEIGAISRVSIDDIMAAVPRPPVLQRRFGTIRTVSFDGTGWPQSSNQAAGERPGFFGRGH